MRPIIYLGAKSTYRPPLPPPYGRVVWHHTSAEGLLGIVEKNRIWASAPVSLNDSSELRYGLDCISEAWETVSAGKSPEVVRAVDQQLADLLEGAANQTVYVVSATRRRDSLNQWQHYSRIQGYAIGINADEAEWGDRLGPVSRAQVLLVDAPARVDPTIPWTGSAVVQGWYQVIYDPPDQETAARALLHFIADLLVAEGPEYAHFCTPSMLTLAALMKNPAFASEDEVRFVCSSRKGLAAPELYRCGPRGIVPYIELGAAQPYVGYASPEGSQRLPISAVMCAPAQGDVPVKSTLRQFLDARGYPDVEVLSSEVPFRF